MLKGYRRRGRDHLHVASMAANSFCCSKSINRAEAFSMAEIFRTQLLKFAMIEHHYTTWIWVRFQTKAARIAFSSSVTQISIKVSCPCLRSSQTTPFPVLRELRGSAWLGAFQARPRWWQSSIDHLTCHILARTKKDCRKSNRFRFSNSHPISTIQRTSDEV